VDGCGKADTGAPVDAGPTYDFGAVWGPVYAPKISGGIYFDEPGEIDGSGAFVELLGYTGTPPVAESNGDGAVYWGRWNTGNYPSQGGVCGLSYAAGHATNDVAKLHASYTSSRWGPGGRELRLRGGRGLRLGRGGGEVVRSRGLALH
jgi:hypothetical protein